jgi:hypothetical protein
MHEGQERIPTGIMTTPNVSRSEQSRINGSKSKGPVSIEGKAASSRNAIKHGFAALINTVISVEDEPAFQLHLEGYRASFLPTCYVEQTLVDQLASINWRQARLVGLETALIDAQISIQKDNVCDFHPDCAEDPYFHLVMAWQALARQPQKRLEPKDPNEPVDPTIPPDGYDINSIELLRRYQTSLDRQFRNTLLNLRQYRKDFAAPPPVPQPAAPITAAHQTPEPNEPSARPLASTPRAEIRADRPSLSVVRIQTSPSLKEESGSPQRNPLAARTAALKFPEKEA